MLWGHELITFSMHAQVEVEEVLSDQTKQQAMMFFFEHNATEEDGPDPNGSRPSVLAGADDTERFGTVLGEKRPLLDSGPQEAADHKKRASRAGGSGQNASATSDKKRTCDGEPEKRRPSSKKSKVCYGCVGMKSPNVYK